jgi:hypothetical protein
MRQVTLALWVVLASVPLPFFVDFVSDIRRSAAGLDLKDKLEAAADAGRDGPLSGFICRTKLRFGGSGRKTPRPNLFFASGCGCGGGGSCGGR